MTDEQPRRLDQLFTSDEPVKIPDWMRQPVQEHELTRAERLRVGWARHSGKLLGLVGGLVVVGFLVFLGTTGWRFVDKVNRGEVVLGSGPTKPPRPVDADGNTLGVFIGTSAEHFAEGEAAIVLPAARATGPFTAKQVATALAAVRSALIEGRLHGQMLHGDPKLFLAGIAPDNRASVSEDLAKGRSLGYATRITPNADPPLMIEDGIRARGTIEYATDTTDDGIRMLTVTTRFIWVYSFDLFQAQKYPPGAELVTLRDQVNWQFPLPDDVHPSSRGLWIGDADVTILGAPCSALEKGYVALEDDLTDPYVTRPRPKSTTDIYDPGWKPGDGEEC